MDIKDLRFKKLLVLKGNYKKQVDLANALKKDSTYINQLLSGHRGIGEAVAREFEKTLGLPHLWFDTENVYKNGDSGNLLVHEPSENSGRYIYIKQHLDLLAAFDQLTDLQKEVLLCNAIKQANENLENFKQLKQLFESKNNK